MYLKNAWYVAAWDHEVSRNPLARILLDEPVVLWRTENGTAVALADRCCHRYAPLSLGKAVGDTLQCGYHGLRFDAEGICVEAPSQTRVPPEAKVRRYPVAERHRWIWIWMGEAAVADASLIPDMHWHGSPSWVATGDRFHVKCSYQALIDIQLDQTHSRYVHPDSLGNDGAVATQPKVTREAGALRGARYMPASDPPPLFERVRDFGGIADVWVAWIYRPPATVTFDAGCADVGTGAFEGNRDGAVTVFTSHGITPETENTTHHFWVLARNFALDDASVTETLNTIRDTFLEDLAMVEAQQTRIATADGCAMIDLNADNPTIQARKLLAMMIDANQRADETRRRAS